MYRRYGAPFKEPMSSPLRSALRYHASRIAKERHTSTQAVWKNLAIQAGLPGMLAWPEPVAPAGLFDRPITVDENPISEEMQAERVRYFSQFPIPDHDPTFDLLDSQDESAQ